jgi:hypothetical protein
MTLKTASACLDAFIVIAMIYIAVCHYDGRERRMAQDTVILHAFCSVVAYDNGIFVRVESKSRSVIKTVSGFGYIFTYNPILRQMTIRASRNGRVGTMLPSGVLRVHNMTVDTGFGIA